MSNFSSDYNNIMSRFHKEYLNIFLYSVFDNILGYVLALSCNLKQKLS